MTRTKAEQAQATKSGLERIARQLFATRGFAAVSAEELVAQANVTRGALYHHYAGKEGLFEAVVESVMRELHARLVKEASAFSDPVGALEHSIGVFLKICTEPGTQRILLSDAPAILGWTRWREMDAKYGLGLLRQGLSRAIASRHLRPLDVDMAAHVLLGALTEAAMVVARSQNQTRARKSAERAIVSLIESWRLEA